MKIKLLSIICLTQLLTSCYTRYYTYEGNVHQKSIGKTKNEILRLYGMPNQITNDGNGGSVLVYEKYTQTTVSNIGNTSYAGSTTYGGVVYNNNSILGGSRTNSMGVSSTRGISQTSTNKTYCNLFLNSDNIVYDFKTNYGEMYVTNRCFDRTLTWIGVGTSCLLLYPALVTIPWAIIAQKNAKKKGLICGK